MKKELLIAALGIGFTGALDAATQREVDRLLAKLAKTPAPGILAIGADCYMMALPPERTEYVCPECGTKTLYSQSEQNAYCGALYSEKEYNAQCKKLRSLGWNVKLDSTFLCSKCRKPDQPKQFFIEVTIDKKTTRTKIQGDDLPKLIAFAEGKTVWSGRFETGTYLKYELPRLRELLGKPAKKPTTKKSQ